MVNCSLVCWVTITRRGHYIVQWHTPLLFKRRYFSGSQTERRKPYRPAPYLDCHVIELLTSLGILWRIQADTSTRKENAENIRCASLTIPVSKVHGAIMGPSGADRTQVGPMLAPWTLLSRILILTWIVIGIDHDALSSHNQCYGLAHYVQFMLKPVLVNKDL